MDETFEHAIRLVEAFVFASPEPIANAVIARLVPPPYSAQEVLKELQRRCEGRGVQLVEVGGGWQFRTALDLASELAMVMRKPRRLPRAAMETLAIVAQYQPLTRAEIEDIRGVALSQATIDLLLERGLITPHGTKDAPGRPALWVTTSAFLAHFGLSSLKDMPSGGTLILDPPLGRRICGVGADGGPDEPEVGRGPTVGATPPTGSTGGAGQGGRVT